MLRLELRCACEAATVQVWRLAIASNQSEVLLNRLQIVVRHLLSSSQSRKSDLLVDAALTGVLNSSFDLPASFSLSSSSSLSSSIFLFFASSSVSALDCAISPCSSSSVSISASSDASSLSV
jgi:hypothetical protein